MELLRCSIVVFQLYTIHFELVPGINSAAVYCLLQNKTQAVYVHVLDEIKRMIPLANPEKILLSLKSAAINAFTAPYPNARILGYYFHLTHSILRKVNKIGMKSDYESDDNLQIAVRCNAGALAMILGVARVFDWGGGGKPQLTCNDVIKNFQKRKFLWGKIIVEWKI